MRLTLPRPELSDVAWQTVTALVERWQRRPQSFDGLDEAAVQAGYEVTHFAKLFRQVMGMPPAAYVRGLRLERAALRLEDPAVSIAAVAEEAGDVHGEGLRSLRRLAGFAPTLTFFRADGSLRVWIPLRAP